MQALNPTPQLSDLSSEFQSNLSNTYVYGLSWDGDCLARGILTGQALWEMQKLARKHKFNRAKMAKKCESSAQGGFELMMQVSGNKVVADQYTPKVIESWCSYITHSYQFGNVKNALVGQGLHLLLLGWYTKRNKMRMRTAVVMHHSMLGNEELKTIAANVMADEAEQFPQHLPMDFKS